MSKPNKRQRFYRFAHRLLSNFVMKFYKVHVFGMENVPKEGAFLLCPNHLSNVDAMSICASFQQPVHFLSKAELFKVPIIGGFLRAIGQIPIKRGTVDLTAIKTALSYLENGESVGVFPQGHRQKRVHPKDTEIREGISLLAHRANVPIIPIAICTKNMSFHFFSKIDVFIGKPMELNWDPNLPASTQYKNESKRIFDAVCSLADFNYYLNGGK